MLFCWSLNFIEHLQAAAFPGCRWEKPAVHLCPVLVSVTQELQYLFPKGHICPWQAVQELLLHPLTKVLPCLHPSRCWPPVQHLNKAPPAHSYPWSDSRLLLFCTGIIIILIIYFHKGAWLHLRDTYRKAAALSNRVNPGCNNTDNCSFSP